MRYHPAGWALHLRWEGAVQTESECVVLLKTTDAALGGFLEKARELHPYDVPELLVLPILGGNLDYLRWVVDETSGGTGG